MTSKESYKEYQSLHRRFESGDPTVSESDVHQAYSAYCSVHDDDDDRGKSKYSAYSLSYANRPREQQPYPLYGVGEMGFFGRIWPKGY